MEVDMSITESNATKELKLEHEDLITAVYKRIREMIIAGAIKPGEKIKQEHISRTLGVSRTPVLKAMERLASDNWVDYEPRHGFSVKELTIKEMKEIFELRELIEGAVARRVAETASDEQIEELEEIWSEFRQYSGEWTQNKIERYEEADRKFHFAMIEMSGNSLIKKVNENFSIFRFSYQRGLMRNPAQTLKEHLALLEAIKDRNEDKAREIAMAHLSASRANIENAYKQQ
jgi:DNA-binding GntR family transcriptional regulator